MGEAILAIDTPDVLAKRVGVVLWQQGVERNEPRLGQGDVKVLEDVDDQRNTEELITLGRYCDRLDEVERVFEIGRPYVGKDLVRVWQP